jgi:tetratricopeptide (TPR) repeat protein
MNPAVVLVLVLLGPAPAEADAVDPNLVYGEIAAQIEGDRLDEAEVRLAAADLPEAASRRLAGLIALRRGRFDAAVEDFEAALAARPDDAALRLYLASAELGRDAPRAALAALEGTASLGETVIAQPLLLARARQGTGDLDGAYAVLEAASRRFPGEVAPRLELMALCAEQDLRGAARAWASSIVELRGDALARDEAAAIFAATNGDPDALPLLEDLVLARGDDAELRARLAYAWAGQDRWYAAATLFERASGTAGTYAFEAADQYRMAGFTARALTNNSRVRDGARVGDGARRAEQRIDILFGAGELARVVALQPELERTGVARPATRMRLAHAHWRLGQYARAAELARGLLDTDEADRARSLLRAIGRDDAAPTTEPTTEGEGP